MYLIADGSECAVPPSRCRCRHPCGVHVPHVLHRMCISSRAATRLKIKSLYWCTTPQVDDLRNTGSGLHPTIIPCCQRPQPTCTSHHPLLSNHTSPTHHSSLIPAPFVVHDLASTCLASLPDLSSRPFCDCQTLHSHTLRAFVLGCHSPLHPAGSADRDTTNLNPCERLRSVHKWQRLPRQYVSSACVFCVSMWGHRGVLRAYAAPPQHIRGRWLLRREWSPVVSQHLPRAGGVKSDLWQRS